MSKRVRMAILIAAGVILLGAPAGLRIVGDRQVHDEVERIRVEAATARVDVSKILAPMFDAEAPNPVAQALRVSDSAISFQTSTSGWCVDITVRRLISERSILIALSPDGTLNSVARCA